MNTCKMCPKEIPDKRKYCSNDCKFVDPDYNKSRGKASTNVDSKRAYCKIDGWKSRDYTNRSGALTSHLMVEHTVSKDTAVSEVMKWFDIHDIEPPKTLKCQLCDWATEDYDNVSGALTAHLTNLHRRSLNDYLHIPEYSHLGQIRRKRAIRLTDIENSIQCLECNKWFTKITLSHLWKEHELTIAEYKEKYNVDSTHSSRLQDAEARRILHQTYFKIIDRCKAENVRVLFTEEEYKGVSNKHKYLFHCDTCDNDYTGDLDDGQITRCYICYPIDTQPTGEVQNEVFAFIKTLEPNLSLNNRQIIKPKELDIVILDRKIAIEFNGTYWHTDEFISDDTHIHKTILAEAAGYRLIHLCEDEWKYSKELVKYKLIHILGKSTAIKIYARNCEIREIDSALDKNEFLNKYHLQGEDNSNVRIGAYHNNELVALMTFGKPRGEKDRNAGKMELIRFATNYNYRITGIASRLFSYAVKTYEFKSVISYADRRWTNTPNVYEALGFKFSNFTDTGYWYVKRGSIVRLHRSNFTKKKLIADGFDESSTEEKIMQERGFHRFWDCGNYKYEWNAS